MSSYAASTPGDGLADGQRVDPVSDIGVELRSVFVNTSGLTAGTGFAAYVGYSYWDATRNARLSIGNYSSEALAGGSPSSVSNYAVTLPAPQTSPNLTFLLQVVANESNGLTYLALNQNATVVEVPFNLVAGSAVTVQVSGSSANLHASFQEVPIGTKAPTWLWIPTDNSTVNGLPTGLERYTGEQSFDLVVLNVSAALAPLASDPIPLPWGGTASGISLSAGMNDVLIPREQFLSSPFGQAIFLGKNTSFNASRSLPLVGSSEQGYLTGFHGSNLMVDLGAYWQNRAISSGPGNITGSTETGTVAGSTDAITTGQRSRLEDLRAGTGEWRVAANDMGY